MRFTQEEARQILRRAGEAESSRLEGDVDLAELLSIADEVGLSRESVLASIGGAQATESKAKPGFFGGPLFRSASIVARGGLTEEGWQNLTSKLRELTGDTGTTSQDGEARTWKATFGGVQTLLVQARPNKEGNTLIEASMNLNGMSVIVHLVGLGGIAMTGPLITSLAHLSLQQTAAPWLLGGLGLFLGARLAMNSLSEREGERLSRLLTAAELEVTKAALTAESSQGLAETASSTGLFAGSPTTGTADAVPQMDAYERPVKDDLVDETRA